MANFEGFGENSPSQSRRPGLENMSERVQLISYSIYDELEVFVDSFGRDAGHGFFAIIIDRAHIRGTKSCYWNHESQKYNSNYNQFIRSIGCWN